MIQLIGAKDLWKLNMIDQIYEMIYYGFLLLTFKHFLNCQEIVIKENCDVLIFNSLFTFQNKH